MGTWGFGLFSDDFACDIREDFKDLIGDGISTERATETLIKEYLEGINKENRTNNDQGEDDGSAVFWITMAVIQWNTGRLLDFVKNKAIEVINNGGDIRSWEGEGIKAMKKREETLIKIKNQLLSPQKPLKKIAKQFKHITPYEPEDVFSYYHSSGNFVLFKVLYLDHGKSGVSPICELLNYFKPSIPSEKYLDKIENYKCSIGGETISRFHIGCARSPKHLPSPDKLTLIAKHIKPYEPIKSIYGIPMGTIFWQHIDHQLSSFFEYK